MSDTQQFVEAFFTKNDLTGIAYIVEELTASLQFDIHANLGLLSQVLISNGSLEDDVQRSRNNSLVSLQEDWKEISFKQNQIGSGYIDHLVHCYFFMKSHYLLNQFWFLIPPPLIYLEDHLIDKITCTDFITMYEDYESLSPINIFGFNNDFSYYGVLLEEKTKNILHCLEGISTNDFNKQELFKYQLFKKVLLKATQKELQIIVRYDY